VATAVDIIQSNYTHLRMPPALCTDCTYYLLCPESRTPCLGHSTVGKWMWRFQFYVF